MATKLLASKATVEQNVQVFFNRGFCLAISRRIFEQFWLRISCEIFRLFVGLGECTRMENWNMLFCITWSNAFQLRSDPEVLFMLPSWSFCTGQSVITPPPFHHVPWDYTENKTAQRRGSKRNKLAVLWFLDLRIRRERATVLRSLRFCKLRKTTKPFSTSFSSQNAVSCLTMRTRALANRTNNKFLDTPAKQHLSLWQPFKKITVYLYSNRYRHLIWICSSTYIYIYSSMYIQNKFWIFWISYVHKCKQGE